ncbi:hypothetical protein H4I96_03175 [Botrytis cinerea]
MATASPTPMGSSQFAAIRRPASRNAYKQPPNRPSSTRPDAEAARHYSLNDSSDDEIPMPMKLSALTKALLDDEASVVETPIAARTTPEHPQTSHTRVESAGILGSSTRGKQSPLGSRENSPTYPRRVVRVSGTPGSTSLRRGPSLSSAVQKHNEQQAAPKTEAGALDLSTPAPVPRTVRVSIGRTSIGSSGRPSGRSESPQQENEYENEGQYEYPSTVTRSHLAVSQGSVSRYNPSTVGRSRYGEEVGLQSSMRVKRGAVPKVFGTFMRGPARRGRPRISQSDEEQSQWRRMQTAMKSDLIKNLKVATTPTLSSSRGSDPRSVPSASKQQPVFKIPAPRPGVPATYDQENDAPPTFRRNKQPSTNTNSAEKQTRPESFDIRANGSPERRPLAVRKAATSTAGAATTSHANNRRNRLKVNGKIFTRLDVIGRGGSSKVYRVMAENSKIFALKRVSLEDADESAIRGFKGEIDLLKKLGSVERVIHLYDYELNDERGVLSVLMEMGELDMNTILNLRMKSEQAKLDINFVRYYWKEMLECLQAVHAYDIVHSDLKPHNFVLVQGRLKLIDFGIANAIQTEETVNVHRETQIGTPNYMSPESLMDSNASDGRNRNEPKLMKLGKPSDIWSLGCILYQMTYGRAPFGHIQNQLQRCQAIINFSYEIEYPAYGVGGVLVPSSLIRTLKNCLNRDQHKRPSAEELLGDNDTFLNPLEIDLDKHFPMSEELLGRILQNVIQKCEALGRVPSEGELLTSWPKGYFASLRKAERGGT